MVQNNCKTDRRRDQDRDEGRGKYEAFGSRYSRLDKLFVLVFLAKPSHVFIEFQVKMLCKALKSRKNSFTVNTSEQASMFFFIAFTTFLSSSRLFYRHPTPFSYVCK